MVGPALGILSIGGAPALLPTLADAFALTDSIGELRIVPKHWGQDPKESPEDGGRDDPRDLTNNQ
jgi:hypothetical protein